MQPQILASKSGSFFDNSELSFLNDKNGRDSTATNGMMNFKTNQTDHKLSVNTTNIDTKKNFRHQESPPMKQMTKSDAQSIDHNNSLPMTEKELSPSSPLKKMMGAFGKGLGNIGKGIGSISKNMGSGIANIGKNLGSLVKLNQLGKGLNVVSKGLGLNYLGKGLAGISKQGLKGLNNLSKGLGLDALGKGLNSLSKLGLDQLGRGLKDISKGLNLRKLQENLKKIAFVFFYFNC